MSEIPFVNQLGDALDDAIARRERAPRRRRFGRRRYLAVALAGLVVAGGGAAIADMLTDPVELAAGGVGCFEKSDLTGNVAVTRNPRLSPVELCARLQSVAPSELIACRHKGAVAVVRRGRAGCAALGLAALPRDYKAGRLKLADFQHAVLTLERSSDCVPLRRLERQVQALLRRSGWRGWRTWLRVDDAVGPCGRVSQPRGDGLHEVGGSIDIEGHRVMVWSSMPRSLEKILFGPDSLGVQVMDSSGERCYSLAGLKAHAQSMLAPTGAPISFEVGELADNVGLAPPGGDRYREGCAIVAGAYPIFSGAEVSTVRVQILQRGGES